MRQLQKLAGGLASTLTQQGRAVLLQCNVGPVSAVPSLRLNAGDRCHEGVIATMRGHLAGNVLCAVNRRRILGRSEKTLDRRKD